MPSLQFQRSARLVLASSTKLNVRVQVLEHQDAIRTFADIEEKIIKHEFPARHLWTDPPQSAGHHIYVALTWTKARARRDKSKPEWTQSSKEEKSMDEWVAYNTRRSNVLMPANSILCGAWITEWVVPGALSICLTSSYRGA